MGPKPAILVIDMLNEFVSGELAFERAANVIPRLRLLLDEARGAGIPVIYASDAHLPSDPELAIWGPHAMAGTDGADVIPELAPAADDHRVSKRTYSAFHDTGLDSLLRGLDVDTVVITGIHTHICVQHTAADAFYRGYKIDVVEDCVDAFTGADHEAGLACLATMYGARRVRVDDLLTAWKENAA